MLSSCPHFLASSHFPGAVFTLPLPLWVPGSVAAAWCVWVQGVSSLMGPAGEEQGVTLVVSSSSLEDLLLSHLRIPLGPCLNVCYFALTP